MKQKIKVITNLAEKAGYNNKIIKQLNEERIKKLHEIESGQKENS